ncbi:hypothetical protein [Maribacter sp. 2210JD10-5]|uniref:hypothetical protein n=1 Tax=Maribacter sp. 2210JD10-5 TaxID=3386272 RepID=UPI0039BD8929
MKKIGILVLLFGMCLTGLQAQEITAFPGMWGEAFYQDKEKLTWKEIDKIMRESQVAEMHWQKSKKQALGGLVFGAANFGSAIWLISNLDKNEPLTGPAIAVAGTGLIGGIFFHASSKNKKMAILEYNDALGKKMSYKLVPISNQKGLGLALKF